MVFKVTVLPPVLGPVMMRVSKSVPRRTVMGTTLLRSMSGCRARFNSVVPLVRISGSMPSIRRESRALAKITSNAVSISTLRLMLSRKEAASAESSARIRSISLRSLISSSRRALLALTADIGSIKKVPPEEDTSWTRPGISLLYSLLTGTT